MNVLNNFKKYSLFVVLALAILAAGCGDDDTPDPVNEPEVITDVKLIFTNDADPNDKVEARAKDPDGDGVEELEILDDIELDVSKTYTLTYEIFNNLETPGEDIGEEIAEEDDEHQIFFEFTEGAFSNPSGNGNFDNAADPINYNDKDDNDNPVGLSTTWTTSDMPVSGGKFRARLQHQPDVKTATSTVNNGDTDFDLEFNFTIK